MGRVYDIKPDRDKGELGGRGWHCLIEGVPITGVYRVELDDDADEGMATVHAFFQHGNTGINYVRTHDNTEAVRVSFRNRVQMQYTPKEDVAAVMSRAVNPDLLASDPLIVARG